MSGSWNYIWGYSFHQKKINVIAMFIRYFIINQSTIRVQIYVGYRSHNIKIYSQAQILIVVNVEHLLHCLHLVSVKPLLSDQFGVVTKYHTVISCSTRVSVSLSWIIFPKSLLLYTRKNGCYSASGALTGGYRGWIWLTWCESIVNPVTLQYLTDSPRWCTKDCLRSFRKR